jgi:Killing trait
MSDAGHTDAVNAQVTDAVSDTTASVRVAAEAAGQAALAFAEQQAASLAMLNAVTAQQNDAILADAALARIVGGLLKLSAEPPPPAAEAANV